MNGSEEKLTQVAKPTGFSGKVLRTVLVARAGLRVLLI
jgi:hypothetical protein